MSLLTTLHDQRDAIDAVILAVKHAQSVGLFIDGVAVQGIVLDDPQPLLPPADLGALVEARVRRRKAHTEPPTGAPEADESKPGPVGAYEARILACLKLAPPLGMTAKEVVKGVAGKKADDPSTYQTVWSALQALTKRHRIRKDGRYYFPVEPVES